MPSCNLLNRLITGAGKTHVNLGRTRTRYYRRVVHSIFLSSLLDREFLIAYVPDEKPIVIIAVLYGKRNPSIMAAILAGRK